MNETFHLYKLRKPSPDGESYVITNDEKSLGRESPDFEYLAGFDIPEYVLGNIILRVHAFRGEKGRLISIIREIITE